MIYKFNALDVLKDKDPEEQYAEELCWAFLNKNKRELRLKNKASIRIDFNNMNINNNDFKRKNLDELIIDNLNHLRRVFTEYNFAITRTGGGFGSSSYIHFVVVQYEREE